MIAMRTIILLAVATAASGLFAVGAGADDLGDSNGNAQMSLKRTYQPEAKMMQYDAGSATLTPGAEKRGLQTVDPAGPAAGQTIPPHNRDLPSAAAAAVTTDAARIAPTSAAQAIRTHSP
jgi:hypothetical protein